MMVLVTYDVATEHGGRPATPCPGGQDVSGIWRSVCSNSVFECQVDPAQWAQLKLRLLDLYGSPTRIACASTSWEAIGNDGWSTTGATAGPGPGGTTDCLNSLA